MSTINTRFAKTAENEVCQGTVNGVKYVYSRDYPNHYEYRIPQCVKSSLKDNECCSKYCTDLSRNIQNCVIGWSEDLGYDNITERVCVCSQCDGALYDLNSIVVGGTGNNHVCPGFFPCSQLAPNKGDFNCHHACQQVDNCQYGVCGRHPNGTYSNVCFCFNCYHFFL
uniref:Uncharacterized protein n=1 Tax=Panagrolaimus sp. JU765 TaxID=591449 RepID=A0AC34R3H2_9BILA